MSKDPLGFDPLSQPTAQVQKVQDSKMNRALQAYRNNVLLRGTHLVNSDQEIPAPVGDDGKALTYERRCELAAQRKSFNPKTAFAKKIGASLYQLPDGSVVDTSKLPDYAADLEDHEIEELGATAQKIIDQQPEMTVVKPQELPDPTPSTRPQQDPA